MNSTQADDEFDPTSDHAGAPAVGSTNSSVEFESGFDDMFDSEVNFKGAVLVQQVTGKRFGSFSDHG